MKLNILADNVEITESIKNFVQNKFVKNIEKHMRNLYEDEKKGHMKIQELSRWGFAVNFDMWLPGKKHIFARESNSNLETAIIRLSNEVERQISDYMNRVRLNYNYEH